MRFAVAIVSDPDLLILDEPTVAMDVEARRQFWAAMRSFAARGKTVLFATHYLEEADANADRAVLMAHGSVVADGPTTEIKARVGTQDDPRDAARSRRSRELGELSGVISADRHGEAIILVCSDSDRAIRALLERYHEARDIEVTGAGLEDAFLQLTGDRTGTARPSSAGRRDERRRLHPLRVAARVSQPALLLLRARLSAGPLLRDRRRPTATNRTSAGTGISAPLYYMVGLASFGTMMSMISSGARIAGEREAGWTRQLRITPLTPRAYLRAKVLTSYMMASLSLIALYISGHRARRQPPRRQVARDDRPDRGRAAAVRRARDPARASAERRLGRRGDRRRSISLLAIVSGTWFPITHGFLHDIGQFLPSYWLVQAGRVSLHGHAWGAMGWTVVIGWTVVLSALAAWAYLRDTGRV